MGRPATLTSSTAICGGESTKSTHPAAIALAGIAVYFADFSSCANVTPPAAFTACKPRVPSEPLPERMTPMALSASSSASDSRKWSIGMWTSRSVLRGAIFSLRLAMRIALFGGMT